MKNIPEIFGSMVFNEAVMKAKMPKDVYKSLARTIDKGQALDPAIAEIVAAAMKEWAVEKGATHFSHWFQPMTGVTADKHDSFISPVGGGSVIMEFSGKELVRGEPDASSFPSGGLRATFEARGYTAWDPTSYAFIKDNTLYIPTAFCSYSGEALDQKTPLLRSMEALNRQAMRILALFDGEEYVSLVSPSVGAEQEYFLITREMYEKRPDLRDCGRTLFGARPPKGQEMDAHYFGAIKPRVLEFMADLDEELWKLGVPAKTEHNEAAPAQHELAPIFATSNIATDHNQLMMDRMKVVARRHGLACLLHEKPFKGVNGSGKHNNWGLTTNKGTNLLEPGDSPSTNARFILFLLAVIKGVDEYQDLLRLSAASAGNDHRLGGNEAPPAIISIFIGDELTAALEDLESGIAHNDKKESRIKIGTAVLPVLPKDTTDRNRTSPIAFTGNKLEFRMVGSAMSISEANVVLNTIVAEELRQFADALEGAEDLPAAMSRLVHDTLQNHKRIIFNGNNYTEEWVKEAERRGLLNLKTTVDAAGAYLNEKNIKLFERHEVYSRTELTARYDIVMEHYAKTLNIEALTLIDMIKKEILPGSLAFQKALADTIRSKREAAADIGLEPEMTMLTTVSDLCRELFARLNVLEEAAEEGRAVTDITERGEYYRDHVATGLENVREVIDALEIIEPKKFWPYPTYEEILYSV